MIRLRTLMIGLAKEIHWVGRVGLKGRIEILSGIWVGGLGYSLRQD